MQAFSRIRFSILLLALSHFSAGQSNRCSITVGGKSGFIDTLGNIVIEPIYEYYCQFY
jgi:hypothetical protein